VWPVKRKRCGGAAAVPGVQVRSKCRLGATKTIFLTGLPQYPGTALLLLWVLTCGEEEVPE
jgi:hypothetical protein